jgi:tRNA A37 threonylcarbamoyladenosine biosynthesis protein TsaE
MDEEIVNEIKNMFNFDEEQKDMILKKILTDDIIKGDKIDISEDVYKDTNIHQWAINLPLLCGSKILIDKLVKHPINNKELLEDRQKIVIDSELDIEILKDYENDVLWVFKIAEEIQNNNAIEILFPSSFILNYMNYIGSLLDLYHIYKIYMIPITSLLYPLSTFLAPYYYINKYMKMNISFKSYLEIFWSIIKFSFATTGNFKRDIIKFVTIFLYVALYLYNMYQTFEIAVFLYKTKQKLHKKMKGLIYFVKHALYITKTLPQDIINPYFNIVETFSNLKINNTMTDIYKLWKDDEIKNNITSLLKTIYAIDVINSINNIYESGEWSKSSYVTDKTIIWDAKNPILNVDQVENPVNLSKNIIVTGPNAGGKTTYVKTILANIILAHTIGITYSVKSNVILYSTINSFMRISDVLGSKSYFEAEAEYCLNMINKAQEISENNQYGLFLMDEPMHSTPPTEGLATAYAVVEYLSLLKGISLIITTHFHKLVLLEEMYPNRFINLSVDAVPQEKGFYFPYKIRRGHSFQCIAIELLDSKQFPKDVIDNAIKMKNKICYELNK